MINIISINKTNKRKKNLSDRAFVLGLINLGCTSLGLLMYFLCLLLYSFDVAVSRAYEELIVSLLWFVTPIIALASLITVILGLIFWLVKKEKPTWKLLLAPILSAASLTGAAYLLSQFM